MKFTKLKAKRADYNDGNIHTEGASSFELVHKFKAGIYSSPIFSKMHLLHGDNRDKFRELFGKPSFCWSGSHYFHCWLLKLKNTEVLILTAKGHGTCYEVVTHRDGKEINANLEEVVDLMKWIMRLK